jgi:REP element-mobilizing transposase RayT
MTSPSPLLFDTYYHIYNRGNNGENIFVEARNYDYFMGLYYKYMDPIAETYAYCLLRNHFHVLLRTKPEEQVNQMLKRPGAGALSKRFSDFFNAYAKAINKAYNRSGSLFQHPFGRVAVTTDRQFWNVIAYIHQNPQKHQFVKDFRDWTWSSYGILIAEKPTPLKRVVVLDWFGGKESYLDLHQQWVSDANAKWFAEDDFD